MQESTSVFTPRESVWSVKPTGIGVSGPYGVDDPAVYRWDWKRAVPSSPRGRRVNRSLHAGNRTGTILPGHFQSLEGTPAGLRLQMSQNPTHTTLAEHFSIAVPPGGSGLYLVPWWERRVNNRPPPAGSDRGESHHGKSGKCSLGSLHPRGRDPPERLACVVQTANVPEPYAHNTSRAFSIPGGNSGRFKTANVPEPNAHNTCRAFFNRSPSWRKRAVPSPLVGEESKQPSSSTLGSESDWD